ncbi:hypothetical protein O0L34_g19312 [Tuta absoluta]|nr:hypothetical protein O0L34_g19312 [Tuta absoluta]
MYLCEEIQTVVPLEDTCILELMKFSRKVTCTKRLHLLRSSQSRPSTCRPTAGYCIQGQLSTSQGRAPKRYYTIYGTYILTVDDNCEYKVAEYSLKERTFDGEKITYPRMPLVKWPENLEIESPIPEEPIKINGVDLTNLKMLSYALKNSEKHESENVINTESVSVGTILLYFILMIGIITLLSMKYYIKHKNKILVSNDQNHPTENPSDDFELKEELHCLSLIRIVDASV